MTIEEVYQKNLREPAYHADIWEHLPTLKLLGSLVSHITEFGVRTGNSTSALLAGLATHGGEMVSYEIDQQKFFAPEIPNVSWQWLQADTALLPDIRPTELLFLDSCHEHEHVLKELRHAPRVSRFIVMHDTSSTWIGGDRVRTARDKFLLSNPDWRILAHWENCNGLTILERIK